MGSKYSTVVYEFVNLWTTVNKSKTPSLWISFLWWHYHSKTKVCLCSFKTLNISKQAYIPFCPRNQHNAWLIQVLNNYLVKQHMLLTYSNLDRLLSIRCVSPHGVDQNDSLASTACLSFYSHSANPFSLSFYSHSANTFSLSFVPGRQLNKIFHHSTISNGCMERQVAEKRQP